MSVRTVVEVAPKRALASALDWPGWSRGAKTEDEALEVLVTYGARYASVARRARISFSPPGAPADLDVVERLPGNATTEFGVPGLAASAEEAPLGGDDLGRMLALLRATWDAFDAAATSAVGMELRKGPRGGGRDLARIVDHVRDAEGGYLTRLGTRGPSDARDIAGVHAAFAEAVAAVARGEPVANPNRARTLWSPRYAVRRAAWHVLDHAWEIEDRAS